MNELWKQPSPDAEVMAAQLNEAVRKNSQRRTAKKRRSSSFLGYPDCYLGESGSGFAFGWDLGCCRGQFLSVLEVVSPGFDWVEVDPTSDKMLQVIGTSAKDLRRVATFDIDEFAVAVRIADVDATWCVSVCVIDRFGLTKRPEMLAVFASARVAHLGMGLRDGSLISLPEGVNDAHRLVAILILLLVARSISSGERAS